MGKKKETPSSLISGHMAPVYWEQAIQELADNDGVMRNLILRFKGTFIYSHSDAFTTLARSIVGQQISVKAAESIWQKLITAVVEITPHRFYDTQRDALHNCGLSLRKADYLQDLSLHFLDKELNKTAWQEMSDEAVIVKLMQIKGIGRWTAEMFLIFHLLRPNVLPLGDLGLQRALSLHYNTNQFTSRFEIQEITRLWKPWCSVATRHLWRSLEPP